jgi:chorismate mutase
MSKNELEKLRAEINSLDKELVSVLAKRFAVTQKVGKYKAKNNLPAKDPKREKELYASRELMAKNFKLDAKMVKKIFQEIIKTVRKNHRLIKSKK